MYKVYTDVPRYKFWSKFIDFFSTCNIYSLNIFYVPDITRRNEAYLLFRNCLLFQTFSPIFKSGPGAQRGNLPARHIS